MRLAPRDRDELLCPDEPSALQIEITSSCNLRCRMCPLTTGDSSSAASAGHMSDVVWSELLPMARRAKQVFVSGFGEPLTNPRCLELLQQLNDEGIRTTFVTNGIALKPAIARRLANLPFLVHINVSIDSPDAASYRRIRGGSLSRALRGLANLVEAMPDTSRITVSSVAMRENVATLADFPSMLAELGITTYIVQGLNDYTDFSKDQALLKVDELSADLHRLRAACDRWGVRLQLTTPERTAAEAHHNTRTLGKYYPLGEDGVPQTRQCMIPWESPYIDKDGRVFPCCIAGSSGQSPVGQLGDPALGTLGEIWVGDAFQGFRKAILDADTTPEVCKHCTIVPFGPHPYRAYAAALVGANRIIAHDGAVSVQFLNTGTQAWTPGSVLIGTTSPHDHPSPLAHPTWLSEWRVGSCAEPTVAPGGSATFTFRIHLPPKQFTEEFQLVVDGIAWLPNTRFTVETPSVALHREREHRARWLDARATHPDGPRPSSGPLSRMIGMGRRTIHAMSSPQWRRSKSAG